MVINDDVLIPIKYVDDQLVEKKASEYNLEEESRMNIVTKVKNDSNQCTCWKKYKHVNNCKSALENAEQISYYIRRYKWY